MKKSGITLIFSLLLAVVSAQPIRLTGVVLDQVSLEGIAGASVSNSATGASIFSDSTGFFSITVSAGDTVTFSDFRYLTTTLIVPEVLDEPDYGIIQLLVRSAVLLKEVSIFSFPSESEFKKAFLRLQPTPDFEGKTLEAQRELQKVLRETYENDKYYYEMWANRRIYELTGEIPPNHFLDPIQWTNFIRDLRKQLRER